MLRHERSGRLPCRWCARQVARTGPVVCVDRPWNKTRCALLQGDRARRAFSCLWPSSFSWPRVFPRPGSFSPLPDTSTKTSSFEFLHFSDRIIAIRKRSYYTQIKISRAKERGGIISETEINESASPYRKRP